MTGGTNSFSQSRHHEGKQEPRHKRANRLIQKQGRVIAGHPTQKIVFVTTVISDEFGQSTQTFTRNLAPSQNFMVKKVAPAANGLC